MQKSNFDDITDSQWIKVNRATERKKRSNRSVYSLLAESSGLGLSMSLPACIGVVAGNFADQQFHTKPILTLAFLFLGTVIGVLNLVQYIRKIIKK